MEVTPGVLGAQARNADVPHVVIVGAGFGGLYAARALQHAPVRVTVLDRHNYHVFQPLLYQVATAALAPTDIASPTRTILRRQKNTAVLMAEVVGVDLAARRVELRSGAISYDYLILASGALPAYFGHTEWQACAPGLKDLDDALAVRRRILSAFEEAERETDPLRQRSLLTFVIIGGGPTGVELAGAISEIACKSMTRDFRHIDPRTTHTILLEAGPRILPTFAPDLSAKAEASLRKLCVDVRTNSPVTAIRPGMVVVRGEVIETATPLWAAGIAPSPVGRCLGVPVDRVGRVVVEADLSLPGHPEVFVIGDLAAVRGPAGTSLPELAPVALQEGRHAARNVLRRCRGEPTERFRYKDRGVLAAIGRASAVAQFGRYHFSGFPAWALWLLVHIAWLIGFRNRVIVLLDWAWAYFTFQHSARLIVGGVAAEAPASTHASGGNDAEASRGVRHALTMDACAATDHVAVPLGRDHD